MSFIPENAVVWTEIPVRDLDRAIEFYNVVFGFELSRDDSGPNPMAILPAARGGVAGHLYPGSPSAIGAGPTVHLALPDPLEAGIERCRKAGGTMDGPPITIPPGRFAYATDPDGNSIGLFEPAG